MKKPLIRATIGTPPKGHEAQQPQTPMVGAGSLIARQPGPDGKPELVECITVRAYYSQRGNGLQPVRACVWVRAPRGSGLDWLSGRGSAGGCGYHKESAAIADAVSSCGVTLYGNPYYRAGNSDLKQRFNFGGTGSSAYEEIFKAIAKARGFRGPMVWVSHGL